MRALVHVKHYGNGRAVITAPLDRLDRIPPDGAYVTAGPAQATYQVRGHVLLQSDRVALELQAVPVHQVPLTLPTIDHLPTR